MHQLYHRHSSLAYLTGMTQDGSLTLALTSSIGSLLAEGMMVVSVFLKPSTSA